MDQIRLVRAAARGDREAFGGLVRLYQDAVVASAYQYVGQLDDAQDMAQETFVEAYRQLPTLRDHRKFRPWLFTILRNKCLRFLESRRPIMSLDSYDELPMPEPPNTDMLEHLQRLSLADREMLVARYLYGLEYREIAETLGISVNATHVRCDRARERLKAIVQEADEAEARQLMAGAAGAVLAMIPGTSLTQRIKQEVNAMTHVPSATPAGAQLARLATAGKALPTLGTGLKTIIGMAVVLGLSTVGSHLLAPASTLRYVATPTALHAVGRPTGTLSAKGKGVIQVSVLTGTVTLAGTGDVHIYGKPKITGKHSPIKISKDKKTAYTTLNGKATFSGDKYAVELRGEKKAISATASGSGNALLVGKGKYTTTQAGTKAMRGAWVEPKQVNDYDNVTFHARSGGKDIPGTLSVEGYGYIDLSMTTGTVTLVDAETFTIHGNPIVTVTGQPGIIKTARTTAGQLAKYQGYKGKVVLTGAQYGVRMNSKFKTVAASGLGQAKLQGNVRYTVSKVDGNGKLTTQHVTGTQRYRLLLFFGDATAVKTWTDKWKWTP